MFLSRTRRVAKPATWATLVALAMSYPGIPTSSRLLAGESEAKTPASEKRGIQHIDLIHFSHTDFGFTDHPAVCRELQKRYLDIAVDAALATRDKPESTRFYWTAEGTVAVNDWWQSATPARREEFLKAVDSAQIDVAAAAMNNTPFMNGPQWHKMFHWLPEDLWQRVRPQVVLQDDVNGFPRAGAMEALNRGIHRLFMGINEDSGGAPFQRPSAFWWKMPDGRRMFVCLSYSYPTGYYFFEPAEWRRGPVVEAGDTRYRPPRAGDIFRSDEASVRKAHGHLLERLRSLETEGYRWPVLLLSTTNQWRIDNDPPLLLLVDFVAAWNRLGLKPTLRLTTASVAMKRLEDTIGAAIPEYQGEWTDWWANGTASAPREVAASRIAKRLLDACESPLWGTMSAGGRRTADELLENLCLFDEHTWGPSQSVAFPYALDSQAQLAEKAVLAYRSMSRAGWLLGQRVRHRLATEAEGLYVANSSPLPWSGWVRMPASALRDDYRSLEDPASTGKSKMYFENGPRPFTPPANPSELTAENTAATFPDNCPRQVAKFWVQGLAGHSIRKLRMSTRDAEDDRPPSTAAPQVLVDGQGWPTAVTWPGMTKPLFLPGTGDFVAVRVKGFAPRWVARRIHETNPAEREKLRREALEETTAQAPHKTTVQDDLHTVVYTQPIDHPRLLRATRRLEVWKGEPRATLTLRFNRISSEDPEVFFAVFPLPCESAQPQTSCGGVPFVPFHDQLPGTCRDYFTIDDWIHYATPAGHWLWVSRDAPMVTFGAPQVRAMRKEPPQEMHRVLAMIFDNFWYTNFVGDSHGVMEFRFDLAWRSTLADPAAVANLARTLASEPQVLINPGFKEDPIVYQRLYGE